MFARRSYASAAHMLSTHTVRMLRRDDTIYQMQTKLTAADKTVRTLTAEQKDCMQQLLVSAWRRFESHGCQLLLHEHVTEPNLTETVPTDRNSSHWCAEDHGTLGSL